MRSSAKDRGRFVLHRKIENSWQWQEPLTRSAWIWMLMKAAYSEHNGLERGQLYFCIKQAPKEWGMSETEARRFLTKCSTAGFWNDNKPDIIWQRSKGGRPTAKDKSDFGARPNLITLCNYTTYNKKPRQDSTVGGVIIRVSGGVSGGVDTNATTENHTESKSTNLVQGGVSGGVSGGVNIPPSLTLHNENKSKKESNNNTELRAPDGAPVSENSQVYNLFIESRRIEINVPDWLPSDNQAKIMITNIKRLLKLYGLEKLLTMVRNYFADARMASRAWSWNLFAVDPVQWLAQPRASPQPKSTWRDGTRRAAEEKEIASQNNATSS